MTKQFSWPHPSDAMNAVAQLSAPGATDAPFACNPRRSATRSASFGPWVKRLSRAKTDLEPDAATLHPPVGRVDIPRPGSGEDACLPLHHAKPAHAAK